MGKAIPNVSRFLVKQLDATYHLHEVSRRAQKDGLYHQRYWELNCGKIRRTGKCFRMTMRSSRSYSLTSGTSLRTKRQGWDIVINQLSMIFPDRMSQEILDNVWRRSYSHTQFTLQSQADKMAQRFAQNGRLFWFQSTSIFNILQVNSPQIFFLQL